MNKESKALLQQYRSMTIKKKTNEALRLRRRLRRLGVYLSKI